jgi:hypothetical protein
MTLIHNASKNDDAHCQAHIIFTMPLRSADIYHCFVNQSHNHIITHLWSSNSAQTESKIYEGVDDAYLGG